MQHLELIKRQFDKYADHKVILAGDFNTCLNPKIDKSGGREEKQSEYAINLINFMEDVGLVDIWRVRNPDLSRYTRRQRTRKGFVHSRLDFFLVPSYLEYQITATEINPSIYSDHSIVEIRLKNCKQTNRGKGFFKFNCSLLVDGMYVAKVKECINETVECNKDLENKSLLWDLIKCNIRGMTVISYSSFKARERRHAENELKKRPEEF
jgi:hypothetical protein